MTNLAHAFCQLDKYIDLQSSSLHFFNFQALWDKFRHSPDGRGLRSPGENVPTRMVDETLAILSSLPRRLDAVVPGITHELPLLPPN